MIDTNSGSEYLAAAGRAAPPIAVSGISFIGISLHDWVLVTTVIYTLLQAAVLIYKFLKEYRK